jgi:SAM-dependent methyltransferase
LGYAAQWLDRFHVGVGESLPFEDDWFDCVSTYQTLEHVNDILQCLKEMVRVTRPGGGIHILCPDYRSTYEGHYRLPWLPLLPKSIAASYLRILGRPTAGLDTIHYTTLPMIRGILEEIDRQSAKRLRIVDLDRQAFEAAAARRNIPAIGPVYTLSRLRNFIRSPFRYELRVNLLVSIEG